MSVWMERDGVRRDKGEGGRDALCLGIEEEPGGWHSPVQVESGAGVRWGWQVGEGIGASQRGTGGGIVGHAGTKVRPMGGGINGGKLPTKGSIDGCRASEGIPSRVVNWTISGRQVGSGCGVGQGGEVR